ncbi:MAG: hypothetical protein Q9191_006935 [Dirinaria sp. TL-2023a]
MADPGTIATLAFSIAQFAAQIGGVTDETKAVLQQLKTIERDIKVAERLFETNKARLRDEDQFLIAEVIDDCRSAHSKVASVVESARKSINKVGTVDVARRFDWMIRKSSAARIHQPRLDICHRSLQGQILWLRSLPPPTTVDEAPTHEEASLGRLSPRDNQAYDKTQAILETEKIAADLTVRASDVEVVPLKHPERVLHEASQRPAGKKRKNTSSLHPERLMHEEEQQHHRKRFG